MDTGLIRPYSVIQWRCQWSTFRGWPSHSMCSRPHFTGKPDWPRADFAENCLLRAGSKASVVSRFRKKTVSRERSPRNYRDFAKNRTLGCHVREISEMGGQKIGSNMRPRYIRFRNIHDRDISGLHCTYTNVGILPIGPLPHHALWVWETHIRVTRLGHHWFR